MSKLFSLKRFCALLVAISITIGISGSRTDINTALADTEDSSQSATQDAESGDDSSQGESSGSVSQSYDMSTYATQLREIAEKQDKIDSELSENSKDIEDQEKKQKTIKKKIDSINSQLDVLNGYMDALEAQISTNKRKIADKEKEITDAVDGFKKRIRAMYIAGTDSYTNVILESSNFYDILMRIELIKRVANHDNDIIDNLSKLKAEYENSQTKLDEQQKEYNTQLETYNTQKEALDKLYQSSEETKKELENKKAELQKQSEEAEAERAKFEEDLSDILKSSTGTSARDDAVKATMVLADAKLEELKKAIQEKKDNNEDIDEYDATYEFAWPVSGHYYISSGLGARWGSYHTGIDIPSSHGTPILACDNGVVLKTNTTCTHDYGKSSSCGCGGGYGNFVIIDHGNGFITLYGHMCEVDVKPGDKVKKGDTIGKMGSTGYSTGDHLHLEIRYDGYIVNPIYYVDIAS